MKRIYHFYLTCMTLTLTMPMMIVSAFAVDDMWTVANTIPIFISQGMAMQPLSAHAGLPRW